MNFSKHLEYESKLIEQILHIPKHCQNITTNDIHLNNIQQPQLPTTTTILSNISNSIQSTSSTPSNTTTTTTATVGSNFNQNDKNLRNR